MGNGALPNGLSYRAHPRLYQLGPRGVSEPCPSGLARCIAPGVRLIGSRSKILTHRPSNVRVPPRRLRRLTYLIGMFPHHSHAYFGPATILNLYRIAHSESTVDKWDNSTSGQTVTARRIAANIAKVQNLLRRLISSDRNPRVPGQGSLCTQ